MIHCPVCDSVDARFLTQDRLDRNNCYFRCRECGSGFSELRVHSLAESAELHTSVYYTPENEGVRAVPAAEAYFLRRLLALKSTGRLLDVGCGRGSWLRYIRENSLFSVEGVEPSEEAASHAREVHGLSVRTGDLVSAAYPDNFFTAVYLRNVLEHVSNPRGLVREIRRILVPGGVCAVHVPNDASITNILKRWFYRAGLITEFGSLFYPIHVTGFTTGSLVRLFQDAGFACLRRETISKARRVYEFPLNRLDIPLLPAAVLEWALGMGNLLLGWFEKRSEALKAGKARSQKGKVQNERNNEINFIWG